MNAVLRSTLRQRGKLPLPPRPRDASDRAAALAYLGITHSHPDWLVARWLDRYGLDAAERWVQFNNTTPPLMLRVNRLRGNPVDVLVALAEDGVETEPARYAPDGLAVTSGNPMRRPADGIAFVQEEASQLVARVVDAQPGERVLDLCASPGGKTTAMAADMNDSGAIVASDVRSKRLTLLRDTVRISGASNIDVVRIATEGSLPFAACFDRVLVDAPCSGLGTVRRDPDIRWRRREEDLPGLARDQVALLRRASQTVRPGGRLIYATCSSEPEENEGVADAFLDERRDFERLDLRENSDPVLAPFLDGHGMFRTSPSDHGLEAFFAVVLTRA